MKDYQLSAILDQIWEALQKATSIPNHPLRFPTLCTCHESRSRGRTVVLRQVLRSHRSLRCYTDARSIKITELRANPVTEWVFHDCTERIQIRARGQTVIHHGNQVARNAWDQTPAQNKVNYTLAASPGTRIDCPDANPPVSTYADGRHFSIIEATIDRLDWLQLDNPWHRRAEFRHETQWEASWIAP